MNLSQFNHSLIKPLLLLALSISLVAISIMLVYRISFTSGFSEQGAIAQAQLKSQMTAAEAIKAVHDKNDKLATKLAKSHSRYPSVNFVAILTENESILGLYSKEPDSPLPNVKSTKSVDILDEFVILISEIKFNTKVIGYIWTRHDKDILFTQNTHFYFFLFVLAALMGIFSFLLAFYSFKSIDRSLRLLSKNIKLIITKTRFQKLPYSNKNPFLNPLIKNINSLLIFCKKIEDGSLEKIESLNKLLDIRTKQLFRKSHYDALTGLPNRYLLVDRLSQAIVKSKRNKENLALLFLDLDRFKIINDSFGHQNGDQLLKEVSKRLKGIAREGDTVARLGGDEFVFLLESINQPKDAARTALRILDSFTTAFELQEHSVHVSTSIGISVYPSDGDDDKTLLKNADTSMYHAKKKGVGNFSYYQEEMNNASLERLSIEASLRDAVANQELKLVYQPQMRLKEGRYKNVEALLRWDCKKIGQVSPGLFIPIAEESGLIKSLDLWVISEACKQLRLWQTEGLTDITVAINVSAGHLMSDTLIDHLKTEIIVNQLRADQIEIEITEQVFVEQTERTISNLKKIKELGAKIAIDDFGTGYSSLQYIQDFPADTLKLDGMFIDKVEHDKASQGIVRSTIILAHSLDLELVAECVENEAQFDFLKQNGCDFIQGYYLHKPLEANLIPSICGGN